MYKRTRRWSAIVRIAWIACLAILFNGFAPIMSHAGESRTGAAAAVGMEVCTALGMQTKLEKSGESPSGQLHKSMTHCGLCVAHAASHGLPPPLAPSFVPAAGRDLPAPLYCHAARPLFAWSLAQPRAPPQPA
jgi:hypothetical protein